jgi:hypothetical protein
MIISKYVREDNPRIRQLWFGYYNSERKSGSKNKKS